MVSELDSEKSKKAAFQALYSISCANVDAQPTTKIK
jgi:hypothetical protein